MASCIVTTARPTGCVAVRSNPQGCRLPCVASVGPTVYCMYHRGSPTCMEPPSRWTRLTLTQCAARSHHLPLPAEQRSDSALWEMKPSPGKGRGLFAAQDIVKGSHVLVETPLLAVSPPALVPGMGYSLSAMAADVEREYSQLSAEQQEEYLSCHEQRLEGDGRDELGRLMAILRSNAYNLDDGRVAIYPKVALINHSCQPNVLNADNGGTRVIVATRDIREGEEVCSSRYLPPHRQPYHRSRVWSQSS